VSLLVVMAYARQARLPEEVDEVVELTGATRRERMAQRDEIRLQAHREGRKVLFKVARRANQSMVDVEQEAHEVTAGSSSDTAAVASAVAKIRHWGACGILLLEMDAAWRDSTRCRQQEEGWPPRVVCGGGLRQGVQDRGCLLWREARASVLVRPVLTQWRSQFST